MVQFVIPNAIIRPSGAGSRVVFGRLVVFDGAEVSGEGIDDVLVADA